MKDQKNNQNIKARKLQEQGVKIFDIDKLEIRGNLKCGKNVEIETNVIIEGNVYIENSVKIGSNTIIIDSKIGENSRINHYSLIKGSKVGKNCIIGPYSRLRTGSEIGKNSQIGNFVEIKNSIIGPNARISHMAFIGDATLGTNVTIGAGTITCNHDGIGINKTIIESNSFIGSNVNLVAPVRISANATIGSGSTITENAPRGKLTLARSKQLTIKDWQGPKTKRKNI